MAITEEDLWKKVQIEYDNEIAVTTAMDRAFKRLQYDSLQFECFGDTYQENIIWDGYIHGESIESEDILIGV